jgi:hypothetical protein
METIMPTGLIVVGTAQGADPHMPAYPAAVLVSDVSDIHDLSLDAELIEDAEYPHIMRRIGIVEGEPGSSVSAFNSSI